MNIKNDDILNATENIILHQVNDMGFMGAGLALQIRNKYPEVFKQYKAYASHTSLGKILIIKIKENQYIANMFSQKGISRTNRTTDYELMQQCLINLNTYAKKNNLSIAIPYKIGCGLAGGDWNTVLKIITDTLKDISITIYKR